MTTTLLVQLAMTQEGTSQPPRGFFDTPVSGAVITGSVAVTGWALDDIGVDRVEIWRDAVAGETTPLYEGPGPAHGKIYIATTVFVDGARPDVARAFPYTPMNSRGGWGYLMLTQGLWNQGNGAYTLYAFAVDVEGHATSLGSKTITADNAHAVKPFGALDVPAFGDTKSGTFFNMGWALTPKPNSKDARRCTIVNGNVFMAVDSGPLQTVSYGDARQDVAAAFPDFTNSSGAGGAFALDTTTLSNGMHQIGWYVVDDCGRADGIGSRFFSVLNGASAETGLGARDSGLAVPSTAASLDAAEPIAVRRDNGADQWVWPSATGTRIVTMQQDERVEVVLPASSSGTSYTGHQLMNGELKALPIGSSIDAATNTFAWHPAPGFLGRFDLVFDDGERSLPVSVVVGPPMRTVIDTPQAGATVRGSFLVAGWTLDLAAAAGSGVDTVHVWAYPAAGGDPIFLGVADIGGERPDVATTYGATFARSGYNLLVNGLPPGWYYFVVYPHRAATSSFEGAQVVSVAVQ